MILEKKRKINSYRDYQENEQKSMNQITDIYLSIKPEEHLIMDNQLQHITRDPNYMYSSSSQSRLK